MLSSSDVLFIGKGLGVISWYRCGMPAFNLGCDYVGLIGRPPKTTMVTFLKREGAAEIDYTKYKIIVLQQVAGPEWLAQIRKFQRMGIKVFYEVDDHLHSVRKIRSHAGREVYTKKHLAEFELCMRACDAMIVSTDWLAQTYRKFNQNVYVCRNGIQGSYYSRFTLPSRDVMTIGWAGGEGHLESFQQWLPAVERILENFEKVRFMSIGLPVATLIDSPRSIALPYVTVENFPGVLCNFDIAIAPAGRSSFFAAKSDLRFLETGALGIPIVADPFVYKDIEDSHTGMLASDSEEAYWKLWQLINYQSDWCFISEMAKAHVMEHRTIEKTIEDWEKAFVSIVQQEGIA